MDDAEMKQACLDLSSAAIALFDIVEIRGLVGPIEEFESIMQLKSMIDNSELIRDYYSRRSVQRLVALGVFPPVVKNAGLRQVKERNATKTRQ